SLGQAGRLRAMLVSLVEAADAAIPADLLARLRAASLPVVPRQGGRRPWAPAARVWRAWRGIREAHARWAREAGDPAPAGGGFAAYLVERWRLPSARHIPGAALGRLWRVARPGSR